MIELRAWSDYTRGMMRYIVLAVAVAFAAGCTSSKCKEYADRAEAECVKELTQVIYIDGQPQGMLTPLDEAKKSCAQNRDKSIAWCKSAPDDVFDCDHLNYKGDEKAWRADKTCQDKLREFYRKTHPKTTP